MEESVSQKSDQTVESATFAETGEVRTTQNKQDHANAMPRNKPAKAQDKPQPEKNSPKAKKGALDSVQGIFRFMGKGLAHQHDSESAFTKNRSLAATGEIVSRARSKAIDEQKQESNRKAAARLSDWPKNRAMGLKKGVGVREPNADKEPEAGDKKILVVGKEEGFSDVLMDHALGMALRNECGIVALNVIPLSRQFLSALKANSQAEMMAVASKSVESFREKAKEREIPFTHFVRTGKMDSVTRDVHRELKCVSFILAEPDPVGKDQTIRASIPVFTLESH